MTSVGSSKTRFKLPWARRASFGGPQLVSRDQRTVELRQFYPLPISSSEEYSYSLDVYFFFPRSFGVSAATWNRDLFYRDTHVYLRLHAPTLTLRDLSNLDHLNNPIALLRQRLPLLLGPEAPASASMTALAQMFGAELTDALNRESWAIRRLIRAVDKNAQAQPNEVLHALEAFCWDGLDALTALRRVRAKAQAYQGVVHPALLASLSFAEEYASAMMDEGLSEVAFDLEHAHGLRDGTGCAVRMRLVIAHTLETLNRRRRDQGFVLPSTGNEIESEYYSYRMSLLKKELQRALYIDTRSLGRDPFYANSAAMVAAGLAATWATLAQVPFLTGQWDIRENFTLFGVAIGAYILKDRIKDWVKTVLSRRLNQWDHDHQIVGDALAEVGLGAFTGRARERMRWLPEGELPDDVFAMRTQQRTVRGSTTELEHVLHYERLLSFKGTETSPMPRGFGVQEILRLSLDDLLRRLDDPMDQTSFYDGAAGRFTRAPLPKVYHLNVVHVATNLHTGQRFLNRARVVLNRRQLLRIEPVMSREDTIELLPKKRRLFTRHKSDPSDNS